MLLSTVLFCNVAFRASLASAAPAQKRFGFRRVELANVFKVLKSCLWWYQFCFSSSVVPVCVCALALCFELECVPFSFGLHYFMFPYVLSVEKAGHGSDKCAHADSEGARAWLQQRRINGVPNLQQSNTNRGVGESISLFWAERVDSVRLSISPFRYNAHFRLSKSITVWHLHQRLQCRVSFPWPRRPTRCSSSSIGRPSNATER